MIVKNEEQFLGDCLRNLAPWVAERIVVDTGSTDASPQIAQDCGAKLFSFPWNNDFAAARNFSLGKASRPWVLVVDADEKLSSPDARQLANLTEVQDQRGCQAFSFVQRNYVKGSGQISWNQSWKPNVSESEDGEGYSGYIDVPVVRLFPRDPQILFAGCVHESVENALAQSGIGIQPSGLVLHHYGQVRDRERMRSKKQMYLQLGLDKLKQESGSARAHFELGIQLQELQHYEEAISHFLAALQSDESFVIADLYAGICFSKLGKYDEAANYLGRARRSLPDSPELEVELGIIELKTGDPQAAAARFDAVLARHPGHVACLCYLGALRVHEANTQAGRSLLEKAIALDPEHADAWVNLGIAWSQSSESERACQCFERALLLKPEDHEVVRLLAMTLAQAGQAMRAALLLEQAVNRHPGSELLRIYYAAALMAAGRQERALETYQEIVQGGGRLGKMALAQIEKIRSRSCNAV